MKAKEQVKNDEINIQTDTLLDLTVAGEQAEATIGGRRGNIDDLNLWQGNYGVSG